IAAAAGSQRNCAAQVASATNGDSLLRINASMSSALPCNPNSGANCDHAIISAAAVVNPLSTGRLSNCARNPKRKIPARNKLTPPISASHIAASRGCAVPAATIGASAAAVIRLVTAIGPTDSVLLLPNSAYANGGATPAYSPTCGGNPANNAEEHT